MTTVIKIFVIWKMTTFIYVFLWMKPYYVKWLQEIHAWVILQMINKAIWQSARCHISYYHRQENNWYQQNLQFYHIVMRSCILTWLCKTPVSYMNWSVFWLNLCLALIVPDTNFREGLWTWGLLCQRKTVHLMLLSIQLNRKWLTYIIWICIPENQFNLFYWQNNGISL